MGGLDRERLVGLRRYRRTPSPTAVVVGVMDRDSWTANTDNLVVVRPQTQPARLGAARPLVGRGRRRINAAFASGGHELLRAAVTEHGLPADASLVLLRSSVEAAFEGLSVTVPVDRRRRYWYPLAPTLRIEDGRKLAMFYPPHETLTGERIHQWIGARTSADGPAPALPDLDRIERQQVLVRALLAGGFEFATALRDPALASIDGPGAVDVLRAVRPSWGLRTFTRFQPATVGEKMVLVGGNKRRRRARRPEPASRASLR